MISVKAKDWGRPKPRSTSSVGIQMKAAEYERLRQNHTAHSPAVRRRSAGDQMPCFAALAAAAGMPSPSETAVSSEPAVPSEAAEASDVGPVPAAAGAGMPADSSKLRTTRSASA